MSLELRAAIVALLVAASGIVGAASSAPAQAATSDAAPHTRTKLPSTGNWTVAIDDVHRRVFASNRGGLLVLDFNGLIIRTFPGEYEDLELSGDSSRLYAVRRSTTIQLVAIDTASLTVARSVGLGVCQALSLAFTGGKVWFWGFTTCTSPSTLSFYDPVTNQITRDVVTTRTFGTALRASPDRPDRLSLVGYRMYLAVYDTTTNPPTLLAERLPTAGIDCRDGAVAANAELLVTACGTNSEHPVFRTADLAAEPGIPSSSTQPLAVAATPDGRYVAVGASNHDGDDIRVYDIADGTPGIFGRSFGLPYGSSLQSASLALSASGRLAAVEYAGLDGTYLHIFQDATKHLTTVTVNAPRVLEYGSTVQATGKLSYPPGTATSATLTREDRFGKQPLGTIDVAPDGTFAFTDTPGSTGPVTYTVDYPDDAEHSPGSGEATTTIRPLPYDVDADGYAETVVGAPGEDIGSARDAGQFHLFYGGPTGPQTSGSLAIHQNTTGVPGSVESGDRFGQTNLSADVNNDGFADIVVSAPLENVGGNTDAGGTWIFFGSPRGLRTDKVWHLNPYSVPAPDRNHARFGTALAAMDMSSSGQEALAIGAPGAGAGWVTIWGADWGSVYIRQAATYVPGEDNPGDRFGWSLASGDINGDGVRELAIGAPGDVEDRGWSTGSVTILRGLGVEAERWTKDTAEVPGDPGSFNADAGDLPDEFGHRVTLADHNGDGRADLAVAAPGAPVVVDGVRKRDAGTATVLYSDGANLSTADAVEVSQQTPGMPGIAGQVDRFGTTLTTGDANGDRIADLAVYSRGDGYVTVIPGSASGLGYDSATGWTQNSSGIPGLSESGDDWGGSLRFGYLKGADRCSLIVGAPGENNGSGGFTAIHSTSGGLTGTGARYYSQDTTGVSGTAESGDRFGAF
jgi:hypothetical protein